MSSPTCNEDSSPFSQKKDLSQVPVSCQQQHDWLYLLLECWPEHMPTTSSPANTFVLPNNKKQGLPAFLYTRDISDKNLIHQYSGKIAFEHEQILSDQWKEEAEMEKR